MPICDSVSLVEFRIQKPACIHGETSMTQQGPVDKRQLLAQSALFSQLEPMELDRLVQFARLKKVDAKDVVFYQGDPGNQMFAVVSGRIRISIVSEEGKEIILGTLGPGDVFGEIALFDGKSRTATATATEASEFLVIERKDLIPFLEKHPQVAIKLLGALSARLRMTDELIEDTLFLNLTSRLAKKLLALARVNGQQTPQGVRINLKLSQQELGNLVGTTRESVNKQLRAWQEEGLISMDRGYITILDSKELALLV